MVFRLCGQPSIGPSGVAAQSKAAISRPVSPPPERNFKPGSAGVWEPSAGMWSRRVVGQAAIDAAIGRLEWGRNKALALSRGKSKKFCSRLCLRLAA